MESSWGVGFCDVFFRGEWCEGTNRFWLFQAVGVENPQSSSSKSRMAATFYQDRQFRIFVRHDEFSEAKLRIVVSYICVLLLFRVSQ